MGADPRTTPAHIATLDAANALGRADVGVVQAGGLADMVALCGDPTRDVSVLGSILVLINGGALMKDARWRQA